MLSDLPKRPREYQVENRELTLEEMQQIGAKSSLLFLTFKNCPISDEHIRQLQDLPRLRRIWLEGTQVTDASLEHIARFPKLEWIVLDNSPVNGTGFVHFFQHPNLKYIHANGTAITDKTLLLASKIPKISNINIYDTSVTFEGLMAIADNPRISVGAQGKFSPAQFAQFESRRRFLARKARGGQECNLLDFEKAKQALLAFFSAMNEWEFQANVESDSKLSDGADSDQPRLEAIKRCKVIFTRFCTDKPRLYGRPNVVSYSIPPEYSEEEIIDSEQPSKSKIVIYTSTKSTWAKQHRYFILKSKSGWQVDHREVFIDGWERDFL